MQECDWLNNSPFGEYKTNNGTAKKKEIIFIFIFPKTKSAAAMPIACKYLLLILLLQACSSNGNKKTGNSNSPLYPEPIIVTLDTIKGYTINLITGDSIKTLLNSFGDTVKTGIAFPFTGIITDTLKKPAPLTSHVARPVKTSIKTNVHPVPKKLTVIPVDVTKLQKVKAGKPRVMAVTEKIMPFREPLPVKALPLRFKDNATANVQYLDVDQGMGASYIYDLVEDKSGNIWLATDGAGLSKYNGVSFTHYGQPEGLSSNITHGLLLDKSGRIWIVTEDGLDLNSFDGQHFTQYNGEIAGNIIHSIIQDKMSNIWIGTNAGLIRYNGKNFLHYSVREGLPADFVYACMEDRSGNIWFGTTGGIVKFDGVYFTHYAEKNGLLYDGTGSLLEDEMGNIWIGTQKGIIKFDGKYFTRYTEKEGLSANSLWTMIKDRNGNIWIGTIYGGINKYDSNSFTHFNLAEGLSNNKVRAILEDHSGNIWLATDGGGINKLNDAGFSYLSQNEVLANNRVRPIIKDKNGNIWFGTEGGGVGKYDTENSTGVTWNFSYFTEIDGIRLNGQRSLLQDATGNIWIGVNNGNIINFNGQYFNKYDSKPGNSANTIYDIKQDRQGNIWFAKDGIRKYNGRYFTSYTEKEGLPHKKVFAIHEDKKGNLWIGTEGGGISKYNGTRLINYTEKEGFFAKNVTSILEDKKGNLWLGTLGMGMCRFDGKNFTYYTSKEGLSNNYVWSLIEDSAGHIWAGTDKGLNRLIPLNNKYVIYNYGLQDGLKALDFNLHSACIDNNNRMWWGTGKNIVIKDMNRPFKQTHVRSVMLNNIEINERFYDYRNLPDSFSKKISFSNVPAFSNCPNNLAVAYDQNHLTFHFSAIDWSAPDKIKYSYRMVGLDDNWSRPAVEPVAGYRNLSHGKYQFQVKAIGQSQVWTEPFTYHFTISPAWWQTWWFKILVILIMLAILFFIGRFIYFYQLRKQRTAMEKQLAVEFERQRISAEMHDDIGAGLSGIRLLTEITKHKVKDEQAAAEVEKIYQSVGDISSKMKEVIWSLNTENDDLQNLISYLHKQSRQMMEHFPGKFNITLPNKIPEAKISGEDRRHIYLAVKEALHNIIKHSGADTVAMILTCDERLRIIISDNGKGINNESGTGNGMKNMQHRIKQLGGDFFIKNQDGLTITFVIPFKTTL